MNDGIWPSMHVALSAVVPVKQLHVCSSVLVPGQILALLSFLPCVLLGSTAFPAAQPVRIPPGVVRAACFACPVTLRHHLSADMRKRRVSPGACASAAGAALPPGGSSAAVGTLVLIRILPSGPLTFSSTRYSPGATSFIFTCTKHVPGCAESVV
jgi:hypothetical protein